MQYLGEICTVGENYELYCETRVHEKDGQQQLQISFLAWLRLEVLTEQLVSCVPSLNTHNFAYIPLAVGGVTVFLAPFAQQYLNQDEQNPALSAVCKAIVGMGDAGKWALQHANTMINVACCVSYVAMIAMGHTVVGAVGLSGLVLIAIKRTGELPLWFDQMIAPFVWFASLYTEVGLFSNPFLQGVILLLKLSDGVDLMKRYEWTQKLLPESLLYPNPGVHDRSHEIKLTAKNAEEYTNSNDQLRVNITHIYDKTLSRVLPLEIPFDAKAVDALFGSALDMYLLNKGYKKVDEADPALMHGFAKLRAGVVHGTIDDELPPNFSLFRRVMRAQLESIYKDESSLFNEKFEMLCEMGNSCSEGWLRQAAEMIKVDTIDTNWAVNHELALARGEIVNKKLHAINKNLKEWKFNLDKVGGELNAHVINAVHCSVYPHYRTYQAEFYHQIHPREMLETAYILAREKIKDVWRKFEKLVKMEPSSDRNWGVLDYLFMVHEIAHVHPVIGLYSFIFAKHINHLDQEYTTDLVVKTVYEAIKPHVFEGHIETRIQWDAVVKWLQQIKTIEVFNEDDSYNEHWVKSEMIEGHLCHYLTEEGVRLLLWDYGILEPKVLESK